jgi:hypothetical protein
VSRLAYGWNHFDQQRVRAIRKASRTAPRALERGGLNCPLIAHDAHFLPWREGDPWNGTELHGDPPASFRSTGTFILDDPLGNVIVDPELIAGAIRGEWGKADTARFGSERSEDAVTWNVFRSLQRAGLLSELVERLVGITCSSPLLYLWGTEVMANETRPWQALAEVRSIVEPGYTIPTEPGIGLHVPGWGDILIEAKFGSDAPRRKNDEALREFASLYSLAAPSLLDRQKIVAAGYLRVPEQVLRNLAYAYNLARRSGKCGHVAALVRDGKAGDLEERVVECIVDGTSSRVRFSCFTWESIYRSLDRSDRALRRSSPFPTKEPLHDTCFRN